MTVVMACASLAGTVAAKQVYEAESGCKQHVFIQLL